TLEEAIRSKRVRWGIVFGIVAGAMAAHLSQPGYLFGLVLIGYLIHRAWQSESLRTFVIDRSRVFAAALAAIALTVILPLYALLQFLPLSNRPRFPFAIASQNALHPVMFLTLIVSNFFDNRHLSTYWGFGDVTTTFLYAGAIPAVLIAYGVMTG